MCFEVGINPQSHPYGFQNEIMDHPCSDGELGSNRIGCTKFCKGYTKGAKVCIEVGNDLQLLISYECQGPTFQAINMSPFALLHNPYLKYSDPKGMPLTESHAYLFPIAHSLTKISFSPIFMRLS